MSNMVYKKGQYSITFFNRKLPLNDVKIPVFRVGGKYRYHRLRIYRIRINILYK